MLRSGVWQVVWWDSSRWESQGIFGAWGRLVSKGSDVVGRYVKCCPHQDRVWVQRRSELIGGGGCSDWSCFWFWNFKAQFAFGCLR